MPYASKEARAADSESIDSKTNVTEIQRCLCGPFNVVNRLLGTGLSWEPADFSDEAEGIIALVNHVPPARIVLRLLGPIAAIFSIVEKVNLMIDKLSAKRAQEKAERAPEPADFQEYKDAVDSRPLAR